MFGVWFSQMLFDTFVCGEERELVNDNVILVLFL